MNVKVLAVLGVVAVAAPSPSYAGWGALACDVRGSGACGTSYGWGSQAAAEARAMRACESSGYRCYIYRWEVNQCIYGPNGSYACN